MLMFAVRQLSRAFSTHTFNPGELPNKRKLLKLLRKGKLADLEVASSPIIRNQLSTEPVDTTQKLKALFMCYLKGEVTHLHAARIDLNKPGMRNVLAKQMKRLTSTTLHLNIKEDIYVCYNRQIIFSDGTASSTADEFKSP